MSYMKEMKEYYRLTPRDLSQSNINTLRWTSLVGVASCLLGLLMTWEIVPFNMLTGFGLALGLVIGFVALLHRLPNFLSLTDKHLDEWGRAAKKDAESFTYRVIIYSLLVMMAVGFALSNADVSGLRLVLAPTFEQVGWTFIFLPFTLHLVTSSHLAWSVTPLSKEDVKEMSEVEAPRKSGKWMIITLISGMVVASLGGITFSYKYADIIDEAARTCVITMDESVPFAQVKHLQDCKTLKQKN